MSIPVILPDKSFPPPIPSTSTRASQSIRRVVSESRPSHRQAKRLPALSSVLTNAWANEAEVDNIMPRRARKYGLPSDPHNPPANLDPSTRTLRPTPDSRRVKPRLLDRDTITAMKAQLGERGDINAHWLALNGFYGGMEAHYAAYDAAVAAEALDLAVSVASRKASVVAISRKGSAADTLLLPEFTILHGEGPLTADQDVPSSPHAPFEWDNLEPFGPSASAGRPMSVEDRQSTYRKMSQAELEIELARKPRPATLQNQARAEIASISTSKSSGEAARKRLGVILDGQVVLGEMERRYGGGKL